MRAILGVLLALCLTVRADAQIGGLGPAPGYTQMILSCGQIFNFAASSTYYCGAGNIDGTDGASSITSPVLCLQPFMTWRSHVAGTPSSAQTSVLSLRVVTTDYTLAGTLNTATNTTQGATVLSGMPASIPFLSALQLKLATGAWSPTPPTAVTLSGVLYCRIQ